MDRNPAPHDPVAAARREDRIAAVAVPALLALGLVALGWGLARHGATLRPMWSADGLKAQGLLLALAAGLALAAWRRRWPPAAAGLAGAVMLATLAVGPGPAVAVLAVLAAGVQAGFLLLPDPSRRAFALHLALAAAVGLAAYAALLQAVARLPVHGPPTYLALLLLPFLGMRRTRDRWRGAIAALAGPPGRIAALDAALWMVALAGLVMKFAAALAPEFGVDAVSMHLTMPAMVMRDGAWRPEDTGFVWAWMPLAADWLFALVQPFGGEAAIRLLNLAADGLALAICAGVAGRWVGPRAAAVTAALLGSLPLGYQLSSSVFVENFWSLWAVAALALMSHVLHAPERPGVVPWLASGLLLGAMLASKLIAAFWGPTVLAFLVLAWRGGRLDAKRLLAISLPAVLIGFAPYAVAWWQTGNPVFPFMNEVFRSPLLPPEPVIQTPFTEGPSWQTLYDLTFHTDRFVESTPGALGLGFLVLLPATLAAVLLARPKWPAIVALGSLAFVVVAFAFTAYARYVMSAFAVWSVLAGAFVAQARPGLRAFTGGYALLAGLAGLLLFANATVWYRALPPAGPFEPDGYARMRDALRPEARIVERINDLGLRHVLWIGRGYYAGSRARITASSWHQASGWRALDSAKAVEAWIRARDFDGLVFASDVRICDTHLCDFARRLGQPERVSGTASLFVLVPGEVQGVRRPSTGETAFEDERLADPELTGQGAAWTGNGTWDRRAGTVRVSDTALFSQSVPVSPRRPYLYSIRTRCAAGPGRVRAQVNWLRADGSLINAFIETYVCKPDWRRAHFELVAPPDARFAVVYAVGHDPGVSFDFDHVSLRE